MRCQSPLAAVAAGPAGGRGRAAAGGRGRAAAAGLLPAAHAGLTEFVPLTPPSNLREPCHCVCLSVSMTIPPPL
jgi:hypothetical protein